MFSSLQQLHCQCVVAAAFTGSYIVSMVIALWMIALATFLYGRRKDKEDEIKRHKTMADYDTSATSQTISVPQQVSSGSIDESEDSSVEMDQNGEDNSDDSDNHYQEIDETLNPTSSADDDQILYSVSGD
ncbi:hypothetical protein Btru_077607 [Bulinus truncatus]|nr:hypothetical protein Btru_077607 [Bulinus truncatus]